MPTGPVPNGERAPDEVRAELSRLRTDLSDTLEELVDRLDVPARVQGKAREVTDRAKQTAGQVVGQAQQKAQEAGQLVAQTVPAVTTLVKQRSGRSAAAAGGVVLAVLVVVGVIVRRSR